MATNIIGFQLLRQMWINDFNVSTRNFGKKHFENSSRNKLSMKNWTRMSCHWYEPDFKHDLVGNANKL